MATMTKSERAELGQLIRKRERVMKAAAVERSSQMLADFDAKIAAIYTFDDDEVWASAFKKAQEVASEAQQAIASRCEELGIPKEFAPGLSLGWYGRGQNAVASRRAELRRLAKSRITAMEQAARTKIERLSLDAQTQVIAHGLESSAARNFLETMPSVETLMPQIDAAEIKALVDARVRKDKDEDIYS